MRGPDLGSGADAFCVTERHDSNQIRDIYVIFEIQQRRTGDLVAEREQLAAQESDTDAIDERIQEAEEALDRLGVQVREADCRRQSVRPGERVARPCPRVPGW